jgi:hypothetical protein
MKEKKLREAGRIQLAPGTPHWSQEQAVMSLTPVKFSLGGQHVLWTMFYGRHVCGRQVCGRLDDLRKAHSHLTLLYRLPLCPTAGSFFQPHLTNSVKRWLLIMLPVTFDFARRQLAE